MSSDESAFDYDDASDFEVEKEVPPPFC
jgi:hypothetical protein